MKKLFYVVLFVLLSVVNFSVPNNSYAVEVNVAGQRIEIPAKYKSWWVERNANRCVGKLLPMAQTEYAARQIPLMCVNMVLDGDFSWEK
jgi:hypothetical protein